MPRSLGRSEPPAGTPRRLATGHRAAQWHGATVWRLRGRTPHPGRGL